MVLKDWVKDKDTGTYISYLTRETKDYNVGQPKHLQVSDDLKIFSVNVLKIMKQWKMADVDARLESKALWIVRDNNDTINKTFKDRDSAINCAKDFMRTHGG